jgi:hypothetical protein
MMLFIPLQRQTGSRVSGIFAPGRGSGRYHAESGRSSPGASPDAEHRFEHYQLLTDENGKRIVSGVARSGRTNQENHDPREMLAVIKRSIGP